MGSLVERLKRARGENGFKSTGFFLRLRNFVSSLGESILTKYHLLRRGERGIKNLEGFLHIFRRLIH